MLVEVCVQSREKGSRLASSASSALLRAWWLTPFVLAPFVAVPLMVAPFVVAPFVVGPAMFRVRLANPGCEGLEYCIAKVCGLLYPVRLS